MNMPFLLRFSLIAGVLSLLGACVTADYIGETYAPSSHVDLYFDKADVGRAYKVMGRITLDADDIVSTSEIQRKMVEEAQKRGADGVIVEGMRKFTSGSNTVWQDSGKNKGKHFNDFGSSSTEYEEMKELTGVLVKYR